MKTLLYFVTNHWKKIVTAIITVILSIIFKFRLGPSSDYTMFVTLALIACIIYFLYQLLFNENCKNAFYNMVCSVILLIFANHLYSQNVFNNLYLKMAEVDKVKILIIGVCVIVSIIVLYSLIYYVRNKNLFKQSNMQKQPEKTDNSNINTLQNQFNEVKNPKDLFSGLSYLGIAFLIVIIAVVSIYFFYKFNIPALIINNEMASVSQFVTAILTYGIFVLVILVAVAIMLITFIELIRLVHKRMVMLRNKIMQKDSSGSNSLSDNDNLLITQIFSIIIVISIGYLGLDFANFSIDDFNNYIADADFIALPLLLIVVICAICIMVKITQIILLFLIDLKSESIIKFIEKKKILSKIINACMSVVEIVVDLINQVLKFAKFIPNFFLMLYDLVFADDNDFTSDDN